MDFLNKKISYFDKLTDTESNHTFTFEYYFDCIMNGVWAGSAYSYINGDCSKLDLPCVTPSGVFEVRTDANIIGKHTGIIVLDLDGKDNPDLNIEESKFSFMEDPSVIAVHKSVSGKGLAIYVTISDRLSYKDYDHVRKTFEMWYDVKLDMSTKNISRLRIVSYDPNILINKEPLPFDVKPPMIVKDTYVSRCINVSEEFNNAYSAINKVISSGNDPTSTYADWISIGFAIAGEFSDSGRSLFHLASSNHPDYKFDNADKKYNNLVRYSNGSTSIGTMYYLLNKEL